MRKYAQEHIEAAGNGARPETRRRLYAATEAGPDATYNKFAATARKIARSGYQLEKIEAALQRIRLRAYSDALERKAKAGMLPIIIAPFLPEEGSLFRKGPKDAKTKTEQLRQNLETATENLERTTAITTRRG